MEHTTARILERSSDAIIVVRLVDGVVLGINEAFFAVTGHPHQALEGQHVGALLAHLGATQDGVEASAGSPIGLWTRSGEFRCGHLSALVVDVDGHRNAVCTIRGIREPTPVERRTAARERFIRIVHRGGPPLAVALDAIQALAESLRWEFGALWLEVPASQTLRCAAVWRSPLADLAALEELSWRSQAQFGVGLLGRSWQDGQAVWASDAMTEPDPHRLDQVGDLVHGWFGFPVRAGGRVIGIVELFSCEFRQPDEELLRMTEELGGLLGGLFEDAGRRAAPPQQAATVETLPPEAVSTVLRDLEETVATMAGASERQPDGGSGGSLELLRVLATSIGKLDRLLEGAVEAEEDRAAREPGAATAPSVAAPPRIPTGLTLKAVSLRTGIPAATLRTWERRYQFLLPERSTNGYRVYGEQEIARILQVKSLLEQGVRIGEAMETVRGPARRRAIG
jgi:MerR HTH family regulatory protein/GAF domain